MDVEQFEQVKASLGIDDAIASLLASTRAPIAASPGGTEIARRIRELVDPQLYELLVPPSATLVRLHRAYRASVNRPPASRYRIRVSDAFRGALHELVLRVHKANNVRDGFGLARSTSKQLQRVVVELCERETALRC